MAKVEMLFEPITIKGLELNNRVIMPAMHIGMCDKGFITDGFIDFYEERAKSAPGPGLIIVGGCYPEKRGMGLPSFVGLDSDEFIPGLRRLTEAVKKHGSAIAAQLYHGGRYSISFVIGEQPVSASEVPSNLTKETPRELTIPEIKEIQENFAKAALRAREAGFDATELICSAGYLVNQFLSPLTNRRTDRYGGDIYARMTFMVETIRAIKEATGEDFPLICRLSGDDMVEGSHTLNETKLVATEMEKAGVDLVNITGGWHESRVPQITMNVPRGAYVYLAEGIKEAVEEIPVSACNRINDPLLAEEILERGAVDMITMGRAFIADPEYLEKAREGRFEDIRKCIACNQGCFDHVFLAQPITCMMNPRVNRERKTELIPAERKKKVLVVGGGPGGLEAAWVAAHRGHDVVLCEEKGYLGGQVVLAAKPPGREEFKEMVRYLEHQQGKEGVDVRLNTAVTPELVEELGPEVIIITAGASPIVPSFLDPEDPRVVQAFDVLEKELDTGDDVLVIGGGAVGVETAMWLAKRGKSVKVLEMEERCGRDIGRTTRWTLLKDMRELGVEVLTGACVSGLSAECLELELGDKQESMKADTYVIAVGSKPRRELVEALRRKGWCDRAEIYEAGDCVEARKAIEAIHEAFEVARKI